MVIFEKVYTLTELEEVYDSIAEMVAFAFYHPNHTPFSPWNYVIME